MSGTREQVTAITLTIQGFYLPVKFLVGGDDGEGGGQLSLFI